MQGIVYQALNAKAGIRDGAGGDERATAWAALTQPKQKPPGHCAAAFLIQTGPRSMEADVLIDTDEIEP